MRRPQPQYEALEHLAIVVCAAFEKVLLAPAIDLSAEQKADIIDKLREVRDEISDAIGSELCEMP